MKTQMDACSNGKRRHANRMKYADGRESNLIWWLNTPNRRTGNQDIEMLKSVPTGGQEVCIDKKLIGQSENAGTSSEDG
jgi:hypothetical protein